MRKPQRYPQLPPEKPINWKRWLQSLPIALSLTLLFTNILWPEGKSTKTAVFWFVSLIIPCLGWILIFAIYVLLNKLALYHRIICQHAITEDENKWWQYYSTALPIQNCIIVGSLGDNQQHWSTLINHRPVFPLPEHETNRLYCPSLLGNKKEDMLSRLLINILFNLASFQTPLISLNHVYWLGSSEGMDYFIQLLAEQNITISNNITPIHSIDDLDKIIDDFHLTCLDNQYILVAGNNLHDETINGNLAESGFVWHISHQAEYAISRCEKTDNESTIALAQQLEKYALLDSAPNLVIAMDNKSASAFIDAHWLSTENILAPYYGAITCSSPFLAISQSTIHCMTNSTENCGWVLEHTDNEFMAGVIFKHG